MRRFGLPRLLYEGIAQHTNGAAAAAAAGVVPSSCCRAVHQLTTSQRNKEPQARDPKLYTPHEDWESGKGQQQSPDPLRAETCEVNFRMGQGRKQLWAVNTVAGLHHPTHLSTRTASVCTR